MNTNAIKAAITAARDRYTMSKQGRGYIVGSLDDRVDAMRWSGTEYPYATAREIVTQCVVADALVELGIKTCPFEARYEAAEHACGGALDRVLAIMGARA